MTEFEKTVRRGLIDAGKTIPEFAKDCGVSRKSIYKAFRSPSAKTEEKYLETLNSYKV